jgi:cAMP-dependent protein kinase regulator
MDALRSVELPEGVEDAIRFALREVAVTRPDDPVDMFAHMLLEFQHGAPDQAMDASDDDFSEEEEEEQEDAGVKDDDEDEAMRARMRQRGARRRDNVFSAPVEVDDTWEPRVVEKSPEERAGIEAIVANNILFAALDEEQRRIIVDAMEKKTFVDKDVIIRQGDVGDAYYVLSSGTCDIFVGGTLVLQVSKGMGFGELALMYDAPRAATVQATSDCVTWVVDRTTWKQVMMGTTTRKRATYSGFLQAVPLLATLTDEERLTIADALQPMRVAAGDTVLVEGSTEADRFYMVEEGELAATKEGVEGEVCPRLGRGAFFGELALLNDRPRAATVTAVEDSKILAMDKAAFLRLLGPLEELLKRNADVYEAYEAHVDK